MFVNLCVFHSIYCVVLMDVCVVVNSDQESSKSERDAKTTEI